MIALTGFNREQDLNQTKAAGFDRHLVKPIDEATLSPILKVVGESRARAS
jgi:CheY-like chemotaxis protein